jgi:hypothetical protein
MAFRFSSRMWLMLMTYDAGMPLRRSCRLKEGRPFGGTVGWVGQGFRGALKDNPILISLLESLLKAVVSISWLSSRDIWDVFTFTSQPNVEILFKAHGVPWRAVVRCNQVYTAVQ